jgi:BioD-like phosphotransacetylase family protein
MIADGLGGESICPGPDLDRVIDDVAIGAMQPEHMLQRVGPGTIVIVPGDREDVIRAIIDAQGSGHPAGLGLVLTGGYRPSAEVTDEIRAANLFSILVAADTYAVASAVHDLLVKTHASDDEKIDLIKRVVAEHLDVDRVLAAARPVQHARAAATGG